MLIIVFTLFTTVTLTVTMMTMNVVHRKFEHNKIIKVQRAMNIVT